MKVKITVDGSIIAECNINPNEIFQPTITIDTSDYLIEISNNGEYYVSNAMNGYGHNCRGDFKDAVIEICAS